jgi:hypothetical protein
MQWIHAKPTPHNPYNHQSEAESLLPLNPPRKGQTGPVQTARKTDGSGHNSKKDRWVRSQLEERHMGPVQTAGMTVILNGLLGCCWAAAPHGNRRSHISRVVEKPR